MDEAKDPAGAATRRVSFCPRILCSGPQPIDSDPGFGLVGDIVVGIVGAFTAGYLFPAIGISIGGGVLAAIIHSTIGAVILLLLVRIIKRA